MVVRTGIRTMPTSLTYGRQIRVMRWIWIVLPLLLLIGASLTLMQPVLALVPFSMVVTALFALILLCILRWPMFGIYVALFGVALFEPFPIDNDPSTFFTWIFHANLQSWSAVPLPFSLVEVVMLWTALAWLLQAIQANRPIPPLGTLGRPVLAFGACVAFGYFYGVVLRSGDSRVALWEVRALAYVVLMYFLVGALFRSVKQIKVITWLIVIGLSINGLRLVWRSTNVSSIVVDENSISGLAHENALFLAMLVFYCIAQVTFGRWNSQRWVMLAMMPPTIYALMVSQRRAAFVVLFLSMVLWAIFTYYRRRTLFWMLVPALTLVGLLYTAAFWNSSGAIGQPARAVRSVISSGETSERDQQSDLYRRIEEYNIWRTIRDEPILSLGFGRPFNTYISMPYIGGWEFQLFTPHNQVFWVWLKTGVVGFVTCLWLFGLAIVRGVQLMKLSDEPTVKPFVLMVTGYVVMLLVFSYVDIGLANGRAMIMMGIMIGVLGRLPTILLSDTVSKILPAGSQELAWTSQRGAGR